MPRDLQTFAYLGKRTKCQSSTTHKVQVQSYAAQHAWSLHLHGHFSAPLRCCQCSAVHLPDRRPRITYMWTGIELFRLLLCRYVCVQASSMSSFVLCSMQI